jgi:glycine cleavage system regulatory protein
MKMDEGGGGSTPEITLKTLLRAGDSDGQRILVLTVIGADRPGLVEALSRTVADHGASWLESRMAHLAGHFAGLLRVSVPEARASELADALRALEARGLRVIVEAALGERPGRRRAAPAPRAGRARPAPDRARDLARDCGARRERRRARVAHEQRADVGRDAIPRRSVAAPARDGDPDELRSALEKLADELMVELSLDHEPSLGSYPSRICPTPEMIRRTSSP